MKKTSGVKGYKVFNPDWTCRDYQYEVGKVFEEDVEPSCGDRGFHFVKNAANCFSYYSFDSDNKVAEVIALGDVDTDEGKSCTNKIQIVREISWQELLTIANTEKCNAENYNTGNQNTGNRNTGDWNTGDRNTGYWNTGHRNTGYWNTGDCNTGDRNTGYQNTGDWNTGDCNTGHWNTGNYNIGNKNTGDWNKSSFNTGCFNTEEKTIYMFNKPSNMTYVQWFNSAAKELLNQIPKNVVKWIPSSDMTDEEKEHYPTHKTTGGYLKVLDESECGQSWWDNLTEEDKNIIKEIPNFDAKIFKECTGIDVNII